MKLDVTVELFSAQTVDDQTQELRSACKGVLTLEEDCQSLAYSEEELGDTVLTVTPQGAVMRRTGAVECKMVFFPGRRTRTLYRTPYGDLELTVETTRAEGDLTAMGGQVKLAYRLSHQGVPTSRNDLTITVKPNS